MPATTNGAGPESPTPSQLTEVRPQTSAASVGDDDDRPRTQLAAVDGTATRPLGLTPAGAVEVLTRALDVVGLLTPDYGTARAPYAVADPSPPRRWLLTWAAALQVTCPSCGASRRTWCVTARGNAASDPHAGRVKLSATR